MRTTFIWIVFLVASSLSACTAEQAYSSGQGWQRSQCNRLPDKAEADRCMSNADTPYDSYKRQTQPERK